MTLASDIQQYQSSVSITVTGTEQLLGSISCSQFGQQQSEEIGSNSRNEWKA